MFDLGLTHVALPVRNVDASIAFYEKYARMQVVHRRTDPALDADVAWLSDRTRPFVVVVIRSAEVACPLLPLAHLGVACASRAEVDELCAQAKVEGCLLLEPREAGPPVGYSALLADPDGHTLELSFGQEVAAAVQQSHTEEANNSGKKATKM
jgi:catechol 2,3-dioxygenase-like lactoylglutathione lyase family enzyme